VCSEVTTSGDGSSNVTGNDCAGPPVGIFPRYRQRRKWVRRAAVAVAVGLVVLVFAVATAEFFVWPAVDGPEHADAIVVLAGRGDPYDVGLRLARAGYAPQLAMSVGNTDLYWPCKLRVPGVVVTCFSPKPKTTQGDGRATAQLARRYGWKSIILVTAQTQVTRARLRLERCYRGRVRVVASRIPKHQLPYRVIYEWGATLKALTLQRSC
jgi:hypothetical protein